MKKLSIVLFVLMIAIVGCSKGNDSSSKEVKGTIEVPESIQANEQVKLKVLVTQGDKKWKTPMTYSSKLKKKATSIKK